MPRPRTSYMSPEQFRALREAAGCTPLAWSYLLDIGEQSIRNIESGGKPVGKQTALLATLLAHPMVRALLPDIFAHKDKVFATIP